MLCECCHKSVTTDNQLSPETFYELDIGYKPCENEMLQGLRGFPTLFPYGYFSLVTKSEMFFKVNRCQWVSDADLERVNNLSVRDRKLFCKIAANNFVPPSDVKFEDIPPTVHSAVAVVRKMVAHRPGFLQIH